MFNKYTHTLFILHPNNNPHDQYRVTIIRNAGFYTLHVKKKKNGYKSLIF